MKKYYFVILILVQLVTYAHAQSNFTVAGTVVDAKTGANMIGVTIYLKGESKFATMTDSKGSFTLDVPESYIDKGILVVNFIGYAEFEQPIQGQKVLNISLKEEASVLDEAVVTGFSTQKKGSIVGSVESITPTEIKLPTRTVSTSLAGRLSGIIAVQNSGEPGNDGASFWIRGINTFAGNSSPLILVDGVERALDDIDPQEIESFTILKDATNTAVYGVRGGNGVILVTTKRGMVGKPQIQLRSELGFSSPVDLVKFGDGLMFMRMQNEALRNEGLPELFSKEKIQRTADNWNPYYYPNVNWFEQLINNWNPTERVNMNVRGGSESARYFISASYLNQNGMFKKFDEGVSFNNNIFLKRYNVRANLDANITKTTLLSLNIASTLEDRNYPGETTGDILGAMRRIPPVMFPLSYPDKTKTPGIAFSDGRNPFQLLARSGYTVENYNRVQSNFSILQDLSMILQGLQFKGMFSFDTYRLSKVKRIMKPRPYLIQPFGYDSDGYPILTDEQGEYNYVDQDPGNTSYHSYLKRESETSATTRTNYLETQLIYNREFGKHNLGLLFLYNQSDEQNMITSNIYDAVPHRTQGVTGRLNYGYGNRYFVEFNFGYNGSENFAKDNRYGFFPALAVGWVPSNEKFMGFIKPVFDYMKFRFSYGEVGNDNLQGRFVYLTRVEADAGGNIGFGPSGGSFGSGKGTKFTYYGNPSAKWETAKKTNLGVELKFLKGFNLNMDFFYEKRENIWFPLWKTPDILGYNPDQRPSDNAGAMSNKGIDGFLDYNKQITKDLTISAKLTFTYATNKILEIPQEKKLYSYQQMQGQPNGRMFGYLTQGYFVDEADVKNSPSQTSISGTPPKPGDIKYVDYNNDGIIDPNDQVYMAYSNIPEITYGLGLGIYYKNFDLSCLFQGADRVSFFAIPKVFEETNQYNVYEFLDGNYWTQETQDLNAKFPRLGVKNTNNYLNSDHWLQNGRYVRLKQAEIGYTFKSSKLNKIGITNLRLYANGVNLFSISPFKWWDPESRNTYGDYYPIQRIVNLGFELNF